MCNIDSASLVIFDFDGVIITNSEILKASLLSAELSKYAIHYSSKECYQKFSGLNGHQIFALIKAEKNIDLSLELLITLRGKFQQKLLEQSEINGSLAGILEKLNSVAICSNNSLTLINTLLAKHNIKRYFPNHLIYSSDSQVALKPSAALYQLALTANQKNPQQSYAVEDSVSGVIAAKIANIVTIGLAAKHELHPELGKQLLAAGANKIITNLDEITITRTS